MIEVNPRVKDALRRGCYKKNYRIIVRRTLEVSTYTDYATFTSESPTYRFNEREVLEWHAGDNDGVTVGKYSITHLNGTTATGSIVGNSMMPFSAGDVVTVSEMTVDTISLRERHVSYQTEIVGTIDNNNLVKESVTIDERMCSGEELKFGLCEGSSIEFQYFGFPNICNCNVEVFVDVQYMSDNGLAWQPIPLGFFDIEECSTQFSTGIIKATGYNKLRSDYLDEKANDTIMETFEHMQEAYVDDILNTLLSGYSITKAATRQIEPKTVDALFDTITVSGTYKYTTLDGDQGPFGPRIFSHDPSYPVTTSTNIYMVAESMPVILAGGDMAWLGSNIRVRMDADFDAIDDALIDRLASALSMASITPDANTVLTRLINMKKNLRPSMYYPATLPGWFFGFIIAYTDNHIEQYGKTLYDNGLAVGTFSDLNHITLQHVKSIWFVQPRSIRFGVSDDSGKSVHWVLYNECSNSFPFVLVPGRDACNYLCIEDGVEKKKEYPAPKKPDGTILRTNDPLSDHVTIAQYEDLDEADLLKVTIEDLPDVTLRDLQSAVYEIQAEFGQLSRTTDLFSGVSLSRGRLYPADDLFPANNLYPSDVAEGSFRSQYSKLWTDSVGTQSFRYLIITYKGLVMDERGNLKEEDIVLQRTVNKNGTTDYYMSDNWLFKNLVWTDEQIGEYADAMVEKMREIKWFPFEMWAAGLPYIEVGDELEINTKDGTYTSYVLQRQLKGIQNLQDTYINGTLNIF